MIKEVRHIIFILFFLILPVHLHAQFGFDVLSVEALIDDHKNVRSALAVRSSVELANMLLHQYSQDAAIDYDSLNVKLDRYTKCFDVIDVIYNGGMMVVNCRDTYQDVSTRIAQLKDVLSKFMEVCVLRGNIVSSDTLIYSACNRVIGEVGNEGSELVKSLVELAQFAVGRSMTTAQLLNVISNINMHLDNIRKSIDHAYFVIWKYVTIRTSYFKASLYRAKTLRQLCSEAFSRWYDVAHGVGTH